MRKTWELYTFGPCDPWIVVYREDGRVRGWHGSEVGPTPKTAEIPKLNMDADVPLWLLPALGDYALTCIIGIDCDTM